MTAFSCCFFTLHSSFNHSGWRCWRAIYYFAFGLSSIFFVSHGIILHGLETQTARMSLDWMMWMLVTNLVGAAVYAARVSSVPHVSFACR